MRLTSEEKRMLDKNKKAPRETRKQIIYSGVEFIEHAL